MEIYIKEGINYTIFNITEEFIGRRPPCTEKTAPNATVHPTAAVK
jgi:hypothetical protein